MVRLVQLLWGNKNETNVGTVKSVQQVFSSVQEAAPKITG